MSRRVANPAAERAAQNQQTIKNLLKLECNKICADCKRTKRSVPREAFVKGAALPPYNVDLIDLTGERLDRRHKTQDILQEETA